MNHVLCLKCEGLNIRCLGHTHGNSGAGQAGLIFPGSSDVLGQRGRVQVIHHETARALLESSRSCILCAVFVHGLRTQKLPDSRFNPAAREVKIQGYSHSYGVGASMHLQGIAVTCGGMWAKFALSADEESPAFKTKDVLERTIKYADDCELPKRWIDNCTKDHVRCSLRTRSPESLVPLPTRVVDVSIGDWLQHPKLVIANGQSGKYVALSHCWGKEPIITTTRETLGRHIEAIGWNNLSRTFQDAIVVTRNLGIQFLWIDSLCIVQNDPADWERESATMAEVYMNAYVTIAASCARDGAAGFLHRPVRPSVKLKYHDQNGAEAGIVFIHNKPLKTFGEGVIAAPLNKRGWVLQERILSPRILYFAEDQTHWECQQLCESESGMDASNEVGADREGLKSSSNLGGTSLGPHLPQEIVAQRRPRYADDGSMSLYWDWYDMVKDYTRREFTKCDDKLPALSGLAANFSRRTGDSYVAGLWANHMPYGLLWSAAHNPTAKNLSSPKEYRAPTWSWASLDGHISFKGPDFFNDPVVKAENLNFQTTPAGSDPHGKVVSGSLTMTARLKEINTKFEPTWLNEAKNAGRRETLVDDIGKLGTARFDNIHSLSKVQIYCLQICMANRDMEPGQLHHVLLLRKAGDGTNYHRVGAGTVDFEPSDMRHGWFDDAPKLEISII